MPRTLLWTLYALLVCIWSSTWVAINIGLEDLPPLFGAGLRFSIAGAGLLVVAALARRPLRSDGKLVTVLASVALTGEPLRARLLAGIAIALAGLSVAFSQWLQLGDSRWALVGAIACAAAPFASAVATCRSSVAAARWTLSCSTAGRCSARACC